ncbi:hypothetical protein CONPUDRAFT_81654 [Coniophora puteana RWD-64-598 SS2]|uniref:Uncharacterized protein n=1 Tax=Coniophora puteana (strain RWD-64-598) TaxID=741705 RepID=A0A5M3MSG9_CONPW|nr:uncharacterized protein CONPUDRAFT_81654 [Coniophora puteana RWD-64-598 SS2]EIW82109.1 hypothetical protein CONPUDRAFT_81654 [Coniophora puteana RWD-64-598 SS2]
MFSATPLDIRPGSGIGIFELGTSLWTVIEQLRSSQNLFPQVEVKYDPELSSTTPVILHLRPHFDLLFSGRQQRLHTICLRGLRQQPHMALLYKNSEIISSGEALSRVKVSRTFGPTYAGNELKYPGVWFSFEEDATDESSGGANFSADGRNQEVKRIFVVQKPSNGENHDGTNEVVVCPPMYGDISRAIAKIHHGVVLYFYPPGVPSLHIRIGETSAQDLNVDLGPPNRIHYKEDERMTIHSPQCSEENPGSDYFYNYFQHGIDFLISGRTHILQKIIIHSNVPGSPLFLRYKRCPWELEGKPEDDEDGTPPTRHFDEKFDIINHFLGPQGSPPSMLLDRTVDEEGITLPNSETQLHGYDGLILEVSEASYVLSVVIF